MALPKSQSEVLYLDLCVQLVSCDPLAANTPKHLSRDIETLVSRTHGEGLSFLTKALPRLGKALDHGLESSKFTIPNGFCKSARNRSTPAFMQAYFNLVFGVDGVLREDADARAIKHLRQVLFFVYKLELPYGPEAEEKVISSFISVEEELRLLADDLPECELESMIIEDVLTGFDPMDIVPRHGPGAVATGEKLEGKWEFSRKYQELHNVYPYYDYFVVGGSREIGDRLGWYRKLRPETSGTAKVVLVPKDSRGPRLISCEPLEYQWIQQGLGRKLMAHLEASPYTGGNVNFTSQDVNKRLAMSSSIDRGFATLDLKDASDRVSLALVRKLFSRTPRVLRALEASRTTSTRLPSGDVVSLLKFAPMGSALCFPVEALCFWVIVVGALARAGLPSRRGAKLVKVFGDDIIVPTIYADLAIQALESFGLAVNRDKSCIQGYFRESCGTDAFKGVDVTPIRCKKLWTGKSTDGTMLASYVALANALRQRGYDSVSDDIFTRLENVFGRIPFGTDTCSYPCRVVPDARIALARNREFVPSRWNSRLQRLEFRVRVLTVRSRATTLDGWPRLLRDVVYGGIEDPTVIVLPRSTKVDRKWREVTWQQVTSIGSLIR
jgi:hypothetical protein